MKTKHLHECLRLYFEASEGEPFRRFLSNGLRSAVDYSTGVFPGTVFAEIANAI
jgi:hypothetical protein